NLRCGALRSAGSARYRRPGCSCGKAHSRVGGGIVPCACLLLSLLVAAEVNSLSDETLQAEAEGRFRFGLRLQDGVEKARLCFLECAELYAALRQRGADNAALDRNLGNAYLLGGDLPRAILAYRRGLACAPSDRRLQECLDFARSQVAYPTSDALGH